MKCPRIAIEVIGGIALLMLSILAIPAALAGAQPDWHVNLQEIAPYTPLEIKMGYYDSAPGTRIGAAVLWNNGMENLIDIYDVGVDANGVTVNNTFSSVASGDVFALGEVCVMDDWFLVPYSDNFDLHIIRWNAITAQDIAIDTSATNHTMTDCIGFDGALSGVASLDFDDGEIDYFFSSDQGASWSLDFSYKPIGDSIIGPFSGGFRPKTGRVALPLGGYGIGLTYQRQTGSLESVLLDNVGSILGSPVNYDNFAQHDSFIGNGSLKETAGLALDPFGYAFGAANGGSAIGFSWLDLETGTPDFRLLNPVVTTTSLGFQGLDINYTVEPDTLFIHVVTNRHVRLTYDILAGTQLFEEIPDHPFADIGGPVGMAVGNDRLYIAAAGFPTGLRGGQPRLMIATLNPDSTVMQGQPLGTPGGPGADAFSVPVTRPSGLILLALLLTGLVWLHTRTT